MIKRLFLVSFILLRFLVHDCHGQQELLIAREFLLKDLNENSLNALKSEFSEALDSNNPYFVVLEYVSREAIFLNRENAMLMSNYLLDLQKKTNLLIRVQFVQTYPRFLMKRERVIVKVYSRMC